MFLVPVVRSNNDHSLFWYKSNTSGWHDSDNGCGTYCPGIAPLLPSYNNDSDDPIALAFPAYGQGGTLGGIVRVLGNEKNILSIKEDIAELSDYALLTTSEAVPENIREYVSYFREHKKGNSHITSLKKRAEKRGEPWTKEYEQAVIDKYRSQKHTPFVVLKSASTNQKQVPLHIGKQTAKTLVDAPLSGYGLNTKSQEVKATVPVF